jgi:hypothetical protein
MEETSSDQKKDSKSKGRETLFRVAYRNQITLIQIADNKANIIISINTMIISSIIAVSGYGIIADRMAYNKANIIVPLSLILLSCLVSAIFAIQAARPKLILPSVLKEDKGKTSLLFYGIISQFTQEQYIQRMNTLISNDKDIYETMTIDLYNQGKILMRKYVLLSRAYRIFMFGFILSVWIFLSFLVMN